MRLTELALTLEFIEKIESALKKRKDENFEDEKGAGGLWDIAGELCGWIDDNVQEEVYFTLIATFENREKSYKDFIEELLELRIEALDILDGQLRANNNDDGLVYVQREVNTDTQLEELMCDDGGFREYIDTLWVQTITEYEENEVESYRWNKMKYEMKKDVAKYVDFNILPKY